MKSEDTVEALAEAVFVPVKEFLERKVADLRADFETRLADMRKDYEARIAAIPAGPQGAAGERGEKGEPGERGAAGEAGLVGRDGVNGADGRAGVDGVHGKDGAPGLNGLPGADGADGRDGRDGADGQDGANGRDGVDGMGFDDMTIELAADDRTLIIKMQRGERTKEFLVELPHPVDRGVYKDDQGYRRGDGVTVNGSWWIAQTHCKGERPGTSAAWRLVSKEGRPGRDLRPDAPAIKAEPLRLR